MLQRIINWITSPFKKKEEEVKFTFPHYVTPLTEEQKSKIKADLIASVKEFKEKVDLDALPTSRVSDKAKEMIAEVIKSDLKAQTEIFPLTEEVTINHEVIITEEAPKKKKRYYKKKNKKSSEQSTASTSQNKVSKK
jgi:hypothetical protein